MIRRRFSCIAGFIILLTASLTWMSCQSRPTAGSVSPVVSDSSLPADSNLAGQQQPAQTESPSATPLPTPAPTDTPLPPPSLTPLPTATPRPTRTPIPTTTPTTTPSPTPTRAAPVDNINRTCPNPAPLKPNYDRYYLPAQSWPTPAAGGADHFWLSKPLPGGGRTLYTDWFPYGYDAGGRYLLHNGIDVSEPLGTPVLAAAEGTVIVAGDDFNRLYGWRCDWYGHLVVIELDDRWLDQPVYLLYGHVLGISVEVGDHVLRGQPVAEVGIGGAATMPHLHFEVRVGTNEFGSTRNPLLWLIPPQSRGLIAGRLLDPQGRPWQGVAVNALGQSEETENYTSWSYLGDPQKLLNPDETLAENFVIGDVRPGRYLIVVLLQGVEYQAEVEVIAGQLSTVEIVTEPLKTATPQPEPTLTPETTSEPTPAE